MACVSSSERNRQVAKPLANELLLPGLQNLQTLRPPSELLLRHVSSCPFFAGSGEPAKRNSSHTILLRAEATSSTYSQSRAGNETTCSN